jgi:hypothetical protein
MRAQLSLELLVYLALACVSLAIVLHAASAPLAKAGYAIRAYGISQFVEQLNGRLVSGAYGNGSMYLPTGLCPTGAQHGQLETAYGAFALVAPVALAGNAFCPDGVTAGINIEEMNGTAYVSRT